MKRLFAIVTVLALVLGACPLAPAEDDPFQGVLRMYAAGLSGDEAMLESEDFNISAYLCCRSAGVDPLDGVGFAYLEYEGGAALVIGETDALEKDGFLFDVWTESGGKAVLAVRGWERNRVYLTRDGEDLGYCAEGADSAFESVFTRGAALKPDGAWRETATLLCVTDDNGNASWTLDGAPCAEDDADQLIAKWRENLFFPLLDPIRLWKEYQDALGFTDGLTPKADEKSFTVSFRVSEGAPAFDLIVTDLGERSGDDASWDHLLNVAVSDREGKLLQEFQYGGGEVLPSDIALPLARFEDMNFDGYLDLVLETAMGAYNEFTVFCLWNQEEYRFDPITTHRAFNLDTERFDEETVPLELINAYRQKGRFYSYEKDGYACFTVREFGWEGRTPVLKSIFDIYDAGDGLIGDRLFVFGEQAQKIWDHSYPEDWYYGDNDAFFARLEASDAYLSGAGIEKRIGENGASLMETDAEGARVLAALGAGETVLVLAEGCSDGWDLALLARDGLPGEIGYLQRQFLTAAE